MHILYDFKSFFQIRFLLEFLHQHPYNIDLYLIKIKTKIKLLPMEMKTIADLLQWGDSFEFIPSLESEVIHRSVTEKDGKKEVITKHLPITAIGTTFYNRFKLSYDKKLSKFVISIISEKKELQRRFLGDRVDDVVLALLKWETENPFARRWNVRKD